MSAARNFLWTALYSISIPASILLILVAGFYFLYNVDDAVYLHGAMGNCLATLIGVVVGIPAALAINRRAQEEQEGREQIMREAEASARLNRILFLLRHELDYNRYHMRNPHLTLERAPESHLLLPLRIEAWTAFSNSGELQAIKDVDLVNGIAGAYWLINAVIRHENEYFSHYTVLGPVIRYMRLDLYDVLHTRLYPNTAKFIDSVIKDIDSQLPAAATQKPVDNPADNLL